MTRATTQKRLPPFGRELLELRRKGLVPQGRVVVALDTWNYGKRYARVVVTPELEPGDLDFHFLAGLDLVELVWLPTKTSKDRRDATIRAILAANPQRMVMHVIGDPAELVWIKSKLVGVERAEYA